MSYIKDMLATQQEEMGYSYNLSGCFDYEQQMAEEEERELLSDPFYKEWSDSYTQESINYMENNHE